MLCYAMLRISMNKRNDDEQIKTKNQKPKPNPSA